jgi:hypothetical protein
MDEDFKELHDLNILNLEKVYSILLDIDEKYQLTLAPQISFDSFKPRFKLLQNKVHNAEYLWSRYISDALSFLESMAVIKKWSHEHEGFFDEYVLSLDIEWFKKFKKAINAVWKEKMPQGELQTMSMTKKEPSFGNGRQKFRASWDHCKKRMRIIILRPRIY